MACVRMIDEAVASGRFRPLWMIFYKGALCNVGDQEARINPYLLLESQGLPNTCTRAVWGNCRGSELEL